MGEFPTCPAPPLCSWVNDGRVPHHAPLPNRILDSAAQTIPMYHSPVPLPGSVLTQPPSLQNVGLSLRKLIGSVDEILPVLPAASRTEVGPGRRKRGPAWGQVMVAPLTVIPACHGQIEGTQKLLNKDLADLITKTRLAQQNAITSLSEECKRQMLTASHTLAVDAKNLLDAVDQAKVQANLVKLCLE